MDNKIFNQKTKNKRKREGELFALHFGKARESVAIFYLCCWLTFLMQY